MADLGRKVLERAWPAHPRRWRDVPGRLRPSAVWVVRLTTATVLAFVASIPVVQGPPDLTGALTALLVVQGTTVGTLRSVVVRVGAVVTGVMVAVLISHFVGLSWWSLAMAVGAALVLAKVLRLGSQSLETAISAMLILAVQGQEIAVENRVYTTLIGAAIGFLFVVVLPTPVPTREAAHRIRRVSIGAANLLTRVAETMSTQPIHREAAQAWLSEARALSGEVATASAAVTEAREARRMNPRAWASSDVGPVLGLGVDTIERMVLVMRNLFRVVETEAPAEPTRDDGYGEDVRPAFAWVLDILADAIAAYGRYVEAEVEGSRTEEAALAGGELDEALEQLGEARAMLADLMTVDPAAERGLWLLRGSILGGLQQLVAELEHEERRRAADQLAEDRGKGVLPRMIPVLGRPVREGPQGVAGYGEGWVAPDASLETAELPRIET